MGTSKGLSKTYIRLKSASPLKGLFVHLKIGFLLCFRVKIPICRVFFENSVRPTVRPSDRGPKNHPKKATFYLYLMVFTRCRVSSSPHSRVPVRSIYHVRNGCVLIRGSSTSCSLSLSCEFVHFLRSCSRARWFGVPGMWVHFAPPPMWLTR